MVWDWYHGRWLWEHQESLQSRYWRLRGEQVAVEAAPAPAPQPGTPAPPLPRPPRDQAPANPPLRDPVQPNTQDPLQSILDTSRDVLTIVEAMRGNQTTLRTQAQPVAPVPAKAWYEQPVVPLALGGLVLLLLLK